ncbi:RNA polymerase III RPC4 domain-containing protein [Phthorimaea operculella]|nr:RNA polymerase III RPC4 domain-containing protein [Phthorimaea operculella]
MSDENVSKSNGLGVDPMQRLASFKPPRDYSLGAAKPNKKVFTPNLNVTRNKNKGSSSNNTRENKKEEKGKRDRKNDRNRDFNKNGPNIIKSSGVFSEGLGSRERNYNRSSFGRESSDSAPVTLQRPTIRVKDVVKIDKELEEQKIKMVMNRGTLGDVEIEDFNQANDLEAPVKLPMDNIGYNRKRSSKVQVKKEVVVKTEPLEDGMGVPEVDTKPLLDLKLEAYEDTDVVDLLRNTNPTMMLIKLPDTLPGRGVGGEDDGPPRRKPAEQPSTSAGASEDNPTLAEGKVGKLQVRRSGRVTLRLGDTCLEVTLGTKSSFHQEIVSVGADPESRSARIVSLGPLTHKLTVAPDWESMLLDMPS